MDFVQVAGRIVSRETTCIVFEDSFKRTAYLSYTCTDIVNENLVKIPLWLAEKNNLEYEEL